MSKDPRGSDGQSGSAAPVDPKDRPPAPLERGGAQKDDNIDDKGNRPDGSKQDQPT